MTYRPLDVPCGRCGERAAEEGVTLTAPDGSRIPVCWLCRSRASEATRRGERP
jgi:hypothetical protein